MQKTFIARAQNVGNRSGRDIWGAHVPVFSLRVVFGNRRVARLKFFASSRGLSNARMKSGAGYSHSIPKTLVSPSPLTSSVCNCAVPSR